MHLSVLPAACAAGTRIVTLARATRIVTEHHAGARHAVAVEAMRPDGTSFTLSTGLVVAAAGALHPLPCYDPPGWRSIHACCRRRPV
ncbi:GMC family oxidoreductase N-terminal domain-containing protein [Streptomyces collinus]|uniref:GMC family oxidoreductase N-terminal domain-containing protein n=1 Tax=Streptomyces collinus TaxID=42684 RepID=UPI0036C79E73